MRGKPGTPYRYRTHEATVGVSVSCIRIYILYMSEIGEIDVPGIWRGRGGQCKYYAYRGTQARGGARTIGVGKGNARRMDIDRPSSFRRHQGTRSSLSALKCANNRSALAFHLGMPLFRSTNSIRARSSFFSPYASPVVFLFLSLCLFFVLFLHHSG